MPLGFATGVAVAGALEEPPPPQAAKSVLETMAAKVSSNFMVIFSFYRKLWQPRIRFFLFARLV
jgi:hypothetical protein